MNYTQCINTDAMVLILIDMLDPSVAEPDGMGMDSIFRSTISTGSVKYRREGKYL